MTRRSDGRETWHRLKDWDKGQAPSERLSACILISEQYDGLNPSHPLGGRDGTKDMVCHKKDKNYIAACYFPRGEISFSSIKKKFIADTAGLKKNEVDGFIFITNQELKLSEREELKSQVDENFDVEIYHLERLSLILNRPINFGLRLEFLDIDMSKEEQLSYMATKDLQINELFKTLKSLTNHLEKSKSEEQSNIPSVVYAETHNLIDSLYGISNSHKCSKCKYGFVVVNDSYNRASPMVNLGYLSGSLTYQTVTCPKCGNVDRL